MDVKVYFLNFTKKSQKSITTRIAGGFSMPHRDMLQGNVSDNSTTLHGSLAKGEGSMKTIKMSKLLNDFFN